MVKKNAGIALFTGLILMAGFSHAALFEDDVFLVKHRLAVAAATTSTAVVVIDLSNTTSWPHKETGEIIIDSIRYDVDKVAASTGSVKVGVITYINASTGTVTWFLNREFEKNVSNTQISAIQAYTEFPVRCRVDPLTPFTGSTPYILSNETTTGSTTYQSDVNLPSPVGNTSPGVGDIVFAVTKDPTNAATVSIEIRYRSKNR
jgi:hypothetical protein